MIDQKVKYFIKVIEEGSFSAAARKLYLSQPALSKQITRLERELGLWLFDRTTYRPTLTECGKIFYDYVVSAEADYNRVVDLLQKNYSNRVRIGITDAGENSNITKAINFVKMQDESLPLSFHKYTFQESFEKLLENEVDICFGADVTFKDYSNLHYDILFQSKPIVICSHIHSLAKYDEIDISMLSNEKQIVLSPKFGYALYDNFIKICRQDGFSPNIIKKVNSFDELIMEVSSNNGIAIISDYIGINSSVKTVKLLNSSLSYNCVAAYKKSLTDSDCIRFIKKITEYYNSLNITQDTASVTNI